MVSYCNSLRGSAIGVLLVACAAAQAVDITLAGSTLGKFGSTGLTSYSGLKYTPSTFNTESVSGSYALGNLAGSPNFNNLGSLTISNTPKSYTGLFELTVNFTLPGTASGPYFATLSGVVEVVHHTAFSSVFVNFGGSPTETFDYPKGSWTLTVNSTALNFPTAATSATVPITGEGIVNTVPSPVAALPFAIGFFGRRRRR